MRPFRRWCECCRGDELHRADPVGTDLLYRCSSCGSITGGTAPEHQSEFAARMAGKREAAKRLYASRRKGWNNLQRRWAKDTVRTH